jgi:hypothetical protein
MEWMKNGREPLQRGGLLLVMLFSRQHTLRVCMYVSLRGIYDLSTIGCCVFCAYNCSSIVSFVASRGTCPALMVRYLLVLLPLTFLFFFPPRHAAQGLFGLEWANHYGPPRVLGPPSPLIDTPSDHIKCKYSQIASICSM